jgi:LmbE family N-acetylglucosaminyl deacetylase
MSFILFLMTKIITNDGCVLENYHLPLNKDKIGIMRWIYISPHYDDGVLSCGGLIHEQTRKGIPVEIWTVCAGFPPKDRPLSALAQRIHGEWRTKSGRGTIILRRREDRSAAAAVGATVRHFLVPDCIYRWSSAGVPLYPEDVFDPPDLEEANLPDSIALMLQRGLRKTDVVVAPLSVGHHVDHVLTRLGVERIGRSHLYYADTPYILNYPKELEPATQGLSSQLFHVSKAGLKTWLDGISAYKSQMEVLFETDKKMRSDIQGYWSKEKGIRLWQAQ